MKPKRNEARQNLDELKLDIIKTQRKVDHQEISHQKAIETIEGIVTKLQRLKVQYANNSSILRMLNLTEDTDLKVLITTLSYSNKPVVLSLPQYFGDSSSFEDVAPDTKITPPILSISNDKKTNLIQLLNDINASILALAPRDKTIKDIHETLRTNINTLELNSNINSTAINEFLTLSRRILEEKQNNLKFSPVFDSLTVYFNQMFEICHAILNGMRQMTGFKDKEANLWVNKNSFFALKHKLSSVEELGIEPELYAPGC